MTNDEKLYALQCAQIMPLLTIEQASLYFNINTKKIRELADDRRYDLVVNNGTKRLIKRQALEKFLLATDVI